MGVGASGCQAHAPTSCANRARSMLPPETTATTFLWPRAAIAGETAAATAQRAGAFGDDVRAFGDQPHRRAPPRRARRRSTRARTRAAAATSFEHRLAAGAVDERRLPVLEAAGRSAVQRALQRRRGFRLRGVDRRLRPQRARARTPMPGEQPAAADRRDHRVDVGQVFDDLEPRRAVAGDEIVVVERVDEVAGHRDRSACASTVRQHSS